MENRQIRIERDLDLHQTVSCIEELIVCLRHRQLCVEHAGQRLGLVLPDALAVELEAGAAEGEGDYISLKISWPSQRQESATVPRRLRTEHGATAPELHGTAQAV